MDALLLARLQFAFSIGFHILFPMMTLGMTLFIALMESLHFIKKEAFYGRITDFLVRLLALVFVMGVASGIVMEFSFGMNWSSFSRAVGDVFGPLLAAEGIFAFFLESVFLGILIFGRKRVSPRLYWLAALLVFIGGHLSAFWILAANSWMQTPAGYSIQEGRYILTSFSLAVFNPSTLPRLLHTVFASWIVCALILAAIGGYYVRRGLAGKEVRVMLKTGIIFFAVVPLLQLGTGHFHAIQVIDTQPLKAAAMEGHFETGPGAPLYIVGWVKEGAQKTVGLYVPKFFSFLYNFDFNSVLKGLNDFPQELWPPVNLVFQSYHVMVGLGMLFIALGLYGLYLLWRGQIEKKGWYLWVLPFLIPLAHVAHEAGWVTAEVGRQPWLIYGLMKTVQGVSPVVSVGEIWFSFLVLGILYAVLFVFFLLFALRLVRRGVTSG